MLTAGYMSAIKNIY